MKTLITFMVSAFWHGFFPLYYFTFFITAFLFEISKDLYRSRCLFSWLPYPSLVCNFLSFICMNYLGVMFGMLTFERGLNFARGTNYLVLIMLPVTLIVIRSVNLVGMAKKKDEKK
jgi:D-alanyl-lipoteichoic acid acyltransferase DltB (MBOAT superfamily)